MVAHLSTTEIPWQEFFFGVKYEVASNFVQPKNTEMNITEKNKILK